MLAAARRDLGLSGRPNEITRGYAARHGEEYLTAPWCDQAISEWARESGNADAVLPVQDRAYTVWHAEDGERLGLWHAGTAANIRAYAKPGAIVFFDWDGTNDINRIDHVGLVERNLGDGRAQTIEANTGDACKRRVRGSSVIAGFWNPRYEDSEKDLMGELVDKLPLLKKGAKGTAVKRAFYLLISHGRGLDPKVYDDTEFAEPMARKVGEFQKAEGLEVDQEIGPKTWTKLILP